jgi:hypothetical protein
MMAKIAGRWQRWLPLALGLLVSLPALGVGLLHDDFLYRIAVTEVVESWDPGPFGLYAFTSEPEVGQRWRELSHLPWWTSDDFHLAFFRPLSSCLLWLDLATFGDAIWTAQLRSIALFLVLVAVVGALHRRLTDPGTACLASVVYAVAGAHLLPTAWISARHALVSSVPGLLALVFHLKWREDGSRSARWLAPAMVVISMLGGELSLSALALLFSYELLGRSDAVRRRLAALIPYTLLAGGYVVFYLANDYGARGTGLYVSPVTDPVRFLALGIVRIPILLGELIVATPASFVVSRPDLQPAFAVWGASMTALAAILLVLLRRRLERRERLALRWLLPGTFVALLPGAAGVIGGRAILPALVASSLLVALLMRRGLAAARDRAVPRVGRMALWVAVVVLTFAHLVYAPLLIRMGFTLLIRHVGRETVRIAATVPEDCGPRYVLIAAADPVLNTYAPAAMVPDRVIETFRTISLAPNDHRLDNVTETGFDLRVVGERGPNFWEWVHREVPLRSGEVVDLPDLRVEILETGSNGPTGFRVDLRRPLDDPALCLLEWRDGALRRVPPPAPGEIIELEHELGPLAM